MVFLETVGLSICIGACNHCSGFGFLDGEGLEAASKPCGGCGSHQQHSDSTTGSERCGWLHWITRWTSRSTRSCGSNAGYEWWGLSNGEWGNHQNSQPCFTVMAWFSSLGWLCWRDRRTSWWRRTSIFALAKQRECRWWCTHARRWKQEIEVNKQTCHTTSKRWKRKWRRRNPGDWITNRIWPTCSSFRTWATSYTRSRSTCRRSKHIRRHWAKLAGGGRSHGEVGEGIETTKGRCSTCRRRERSWQFDSWNFPCRKPTTGIAAT